MGRFITFEGIEGSGKTTQIRRTADYLTKKNIPCLVTREPGGTVLGGELRNLLLNTTSLRIAEKTELLLFGADRAQHVEEVIRPALRQGTLVLCDRFSDATVAYQGYGRGLDREIIEIINNLASPSLQPDVTFLFDLSEEIGLERVSHREILADSGVPSKDRFEREKLEFHRKVRAGYLALARAEPSRFRVIDAAREIDKVHEAVCGCLSEILEA